MSKIGSPMGPPPPGTFAPIIGPILIGAVLDFFLLGIISSQALFYFQNNQKDKTSNKIIVSFLVLLSVFHSGLCASTAYGWTVTNYGHPELLQPPWQFALEIPITGITSFIVQSFFARRSYLLSKSLIVPIIIMILTTTSTVFSIALIIVQETIGLIDNNGPRGPIYLLPMWSSTACLADIIITATLVYYFKKSRSDFSDTNVILDKIINFTVRAGALSTLGSIMVIIPIYALPGLYSVIFQWVMAKLYLNSLLSSLNARTMLSAELSKSTNSFTVGSKSGETKYTSRIDLRGLSSIKVEINEISQIDDDSSVATPSPRRLHFTRSAKQNPMIDEESGSIESGEAL